MKMFNKSRLTLGILVSFILFFFIVSPAFASNFYLSSQKSDIALGETIPVNVVIDTNNESINGVSAFLNYPNDKLEVAWISYGEAFPIQAEESNEKGVIRISRGSFTGEVGNVTVATIGFRGKAQGAATVSFINESAAPRTIDSSDSLNLEESRGETFAVEQSQSESNIIVFLLQQFLSLLA